MHEAEQRRHAHYRAQGWWPGEPLVEVYARRVREQADALAVVDDRGRRLTHAELWDAAGDLAREFETHGLRAHDVGLIFLPNRTECQVVFLALLRLGAIPAHIPIRTDVDTLRYVSELARVRLIIAPAHHGNTAAGALARAAASSCKHAVSVLAIGDEGTFDWSDDTARPLPTAPRAKGLDHLMFTSSTTGRPKAVMHTADSLAALNIAFVERFSVGPDRPIFMPSPMGHSVGAVHGARLSVFSAAPLVLQDRWDPLRALELVAEHDCGFTAAATPFLKDLVDAPWDRAQPKLAAMRWFLCGGAQVSPTLMAQARRAFPNTFVTVLWGMTEGVGTTCVSNSPPDKVLHTAGIGLAGVELRALGPDGEQVPHGEEGELAIRGPGMFFGYYAQEDLYRSLLTRDGFFRTGDLARIDDEGYVRITGRIKDLIIRGGVNISPVPIEDALAGHPEISAASVVGYPDERLGERICAVVIPTGEGRPDARALGEFLRDRGLPKHLCPEIVRFVDQFPRTAAGKIRKLQLRDSVLEADASNSRGAG